MSESLSKSAAPCAFAESFFSPQSATAQMNGVDFSLRYYARSKISVKGL